MRYFILILTIIFLLSGCGSSPMQSAVSDFNHQLYMGTNLSRNIALGEKALYYTMDNYIYVVDLETLSVLPLCGKPNCLHNLETDPARISNCNAYLPHPGGKSPIFWSGNALYTITATDKSDSYNRIIFALTEISADGARRRQVHVFEDLPEGEAITVGSRLAVHRGNLYWIQITYNEEMTTESSIWTYALDGSNEPTLVCSPQYNDEILLPDHIRFTNNAITFLSPLKQTSEPMVAFQTDMTNGKTIRLFDIGRPVSAGECIPWNDGMFTQLILMEERDPKNPHAFTSHSYVAKKDGSMPTAWGNINGGTVIADELYLYKLYPSLLAELQGYEGKTLEIYDTNADLVASFDLQTVIPDYQALCIAEDYVLIVPSTGTLYYFLRSDIETGILNILPLR